MMESFLARREAHKKLEDFGLMLNDPRGLLVIQLLTWKGMSVAELSQAAHISKSVAMNYLNKLEELKVLKFKINNFIRTNDKKIYNLEPNLFELLKKMAK